MLINLFVLAITIGAGGFTLLWVLRPDLRRSIEAPKYRVARWQDANTRRRADHDPPQPNRPIA